MTTTTLRKIRKDFAAPVSKKWLIGLRYSSNQATALRPQSYRDKVSAFSQRPSDPGVNADVDQRAGTAFHEAVSYVIS